MVKCVAKDGRAEELVELLGRMAAVASRDDGTELYVVHRARQDGNVVFIYELYRDKEALKLHQANAQLRDLGRGMAELTDSVEVLVGNVVAGDVSRRT
jgi:quinol monooxygenase YgiN